MSLLANRLDAILIHYSTDYVFSGNKGSPYTIFDNPSPISNYGHSKLLGENSVQYVANKYFLIRLSWVFGKGNDYFVTKVINWRRKSNQIKIVIDQISSPSYTEDIVKATYKLMTIENYGLYHMNNSGFCSRYQWASFILNQIGWKGKILPALSYEFKISAKRQFMSLLDTTILEKEIGHEFPSWQEATKRFLEDLEVINQS